MEQVQVIEEKEMTSKLLKQFLIRTFLYSLVYLGIIAILFIVSLSFNRKGELGLVLSILLITAINILFLLTLSKLATTEAFYGINTTSAPRKSLKRILDKISVPLIIFTSIFSFCDILLLHSFLDVSDGYNKFEMFTFGLMILLNIISVVSVVNIYERRILKKYLIITD